MSIIICTVCKRMMVTTVDEHDGPMQCGNCGAGLKVLIKNNVTMIVRAARINVEIPKALSGVTRRILAEAINCYDCGSNIGAVVLCRLFTEGLLVEAGVQKGHLADMIAKAHELRLIPTHVYHAASASRLIGNAGAHYSDDLTTITSTEAEVVLRLVCGAAETIESKLPS